MIKYKLVEIYDNIFAVAISDKYDLAMLFCRVQEFYESPNLKIRNKKFSFWEYHKWYAKNHKDCFSYCSDWSGFNLPIEIAINCYKKNKIETPYDDLFVNIIKKTKSKNGYIIGVDKLGSKTYLHEFCHGLYYVDKDYKKQMNDITNLLSKSNKNRFIKNLKSQGYHSSVINDEIQAYMATEINKTMTKGIRNKIKIHNNYKKVLGLYV